MPATNSDDTTVPSRHISPHQIWRIFRDLSKRAGLNRAIRPHDVRRYYVTYLLRNDVDVLTVSRLVGHKHATTTAKYDHRHLEDLRHIVENLKLPVMDADENATEESVDPTGSGGLS